jgi:hypothetical protein
VRFIEIVNIDGKLEAFDETGNWWREADRSLYLGLRLRVNELCLFTFVCAFMACSDSFVFTLTL